MKNELSKLSSETKVATAELHNGSFTDPSGRRKSKRFKSDGERHFPTGCGSVPTRPRSRRVMNKEDVDFVPSSEAMVELKSVDEKLLGVTEGAEEMKDMNLPEKTSGLNVSEALKEDGSFIFASEDEVVRSGGWRRIGTKYLGGRKIIAIRDFPPNTGTNFSDYGKTVKEAMSKEERKKDCGDHLGQSLAKSMAPYVLEPLELEKPKVTVPTPNEAAGKMEKREGVAIPSPLKSPKKMNGDNGEGSRRKNSEKLIPCKKSVARKTRLSDDELPPSRPSGSSSGDSARDKVMETLRLFSGICRKLIREEEANPGKRKAQNFSVSVEAAKIVKSKGKYLNVGSHIIGTVPGVEVGDEFQFRCELNFLGVHRPSQGGIDYMRDKNNELVATSIVASGGYDDDLDKSDELTYTGQGGNVIKKTQLNNAPKDQELVRGNLALVNSKDRQNPVRVIRGNKKAPAGSSDSKNYVYDGLYLVEEFWKEIGSHGKLVFKFRLRRIPGQPELTWKVVKKAKSSKVRAGLCCDDISDGKERLPICAVNEVDDEKPPEFIYTVKMIYPDWCQPIPPKGCGCRKRCTYSTNCACIAKNKGESGEGELPYNYDGAIVFIKDMVYECGPLCKCPPDCYLRVTQRGIKFQLEIFKTEKRGWGVRSLESIPSGSFICEYAGELLQENEANRLAGQDEYLFDIGTGSEKGSFTIDAARKGNIGRFVNHSCSPNLYAQDVLYHHEDPRIPHVMLFAHDNIPPFKELTYDYNYKIDQVTDADGNIKKKNCYCGSSACTGRLY